MSNYSDVITNDPKWKDLHDISAMEETSWVPIVLVAAHIIIFFGSVIGNSLTCFVIYYDRNMHTATNYYLFNLAISDLIVTFAILLEIYEQIHESYQFGRWTCKIHFFLVVVMWNNSILVMTALAIERYIAIWHPMILKSKPELRRVLKIITLLWIIAIIEGIPEIGTFELMKYKTYSVCFIVQSTYARIVNGVLALVTFLIPLAIMVSMYSMIALKVNVAERTKYSDKVFNHRSNRKKVNKLVVALTLSFLICWLPFFSTRVMVVVSSSWLQDLKVDVWWCTLYRIVSFNCWFSMMLNPLLFSVMSTKFRKSLRTLWNSKMKIRDSREITTV